MDKKFMHKLDAMELDMVAGGHRVGRWYEKEHRQSYFTGIKNGLKNFFKKFQPQLTPPTKCPI